jgi:hypothetical protein
MEQMERTEMLTPAGDARLVVDSAIVDRLVSELGYIVIEPTTLPLTHEAARFFPEEAAPEVSEADVVDDESPKTDDGDDSSSDENESADADGDGEPAKTSLDYSAVEAAAIISDLSEYDLVEFLDEKEERSTVKRAAEARVKALEAADAE